MWFEIKPAKNSGRYFLSAESRCFGKARNKPYFGEVKYGARSCEDS